MAEPARAPAWKPRGAWDGVAEPGRSGRAEGRPGVIAARRDGLRLATVSGEGAGRPGISEEDGVLLVWSGPEQSLAVSEAPDLLDRLRRRFGPAAAISNQTGGRAILEVSGADARRCLAKGVGLDLHPQAFPPGHAAATSVAHIGVLLWRAQDGDERFTFAVPASYAASFWSWFTASAAEYGLEVR